MSNQGIGPIWLPLLLCLARATEREPASRGHRESETPGSEGRGDKFCMSSWVSLHSQGEAKPEAHLCPPWGKRDLLVNERNRPVGPSSLRDLPTCRERAILLGCSVSFHLKPLSLQEKKICIPSSESMSHLNSQRAI